MPSLAEHPSSTVVKALIVGDSGVGKTGGLASLVDAGYKLRILDFEAGLDPLAGYVKDRSKLGNVSYHTLKDEFQILGSNVAIKRAPSFQTAMKLLNDWDGAGPVQKWEEPENTILVIDALSSMSRACFNMVLQANNALGPQGTKGGPEIGHWGAAMENIEKFLGQITNPTLVPCHLIVLTHITYQEREGEGLVKAFPEALGSKLNPKIARYFNNMISLSVTGGERSYKTKRDGLITCKTSRAIQDKYKIESGLADIFRDLLPKAP